MDTITISLASIPSRVHLLEKVITTLSPQADSICVYLNNYDDVPAFLLSTRNVIVERSQDHGDLADNGKFYWTVPSGYHLTVDDDIRYPDDYVERIIERIDFYGKRAVVGLHGSIFTQPIQSFYNSRIVFGFWEELEKDRKVDMIGTGTMGYHTSTIIFPLDAFKTTRMADIWSSVLCLTKGVDIYCIKRERDWLSILPTVQGIYETFSKNDAIQTKLVRELPWAAMRNR